MAHRNLEIKDGRLYVERQCIQLNDIVSATVEQTTRGVRASRIALVYFFCLLVGGIALFPYTLVFAVVMWSLAGGVFMAVSFLRTTCWLVHLNRRSNQQTTVTFSEEADARNFLSALGKPTKGSCHL